MGTPDPSESHEPLEFELLQESADSLTTTTQARLWASIAAAVAIAVPILLKSSNILPQSWPQVVMESTALAMLFWLTVYFLGRALPQVTPTGETLEPWHGIALTSLEPQRSLPSHSRRFLQQLEYRLRKSPNNPLVLNDLAVYRVAEGNTEDAVKLWEQALEAFPQYSRAHANLACLLEHQQNWERAARHYQLASQVHNQDLPELLARQARCLSKAGRAAEAANAWQRAVLLQSNPEWIETLAGVLEQLGRLAEAEQVRARLRAT